MARRLWQRYSKIVDRTSGWPNVVAGLLIIPLIAVVVFTAFMRTFTPFYPDWGFLMTLFLYGTAIMLAGAEVLRKDEHVAIDIVPTLLPLKAGDVLRIFSTLVILVVSVTFVFIGSDMAWASTLINEHSPHQSRFNPPTWWFRWIIPLSFFFISLEALRRLGNQIRNFGKVAIEDTSDNVPMIDDEKGSHA